MAIVLSDAQIEDSLSKVGRGLEKYLGIQARLHHCDVRIDVEFRRRFNGFYRVRRGAEWQAAFFGLLERAKTEPPTFGEILSELRRATGRYEASFASKLLATVDPDMPVIDSIVLGNLGLRLPASTSQNRAAGIEGVHQALVKEFDAFLQSDPGRRLVNRFRQTHPSAEITETKMLDLVLWQTRNGQ